MVLQVAKDDSKEKEFSDVQLPLPATGDGKGYEEEQPIHVKRKRAEICKILSLTFNALLIVAVILLAIQVCTLKKKSHEQRNRDDFEITPRQANEADDSFDLKGDIPREAHEKIRQMKEEGLSWYKNRMRVKFFVCITRNDRDSWWDQR